MLVTIGNHRFNLMNVTRIFTGDAGHYGRVYFTDGTYSELDNDEMTALLKFWDKHAELLTPIAATDHETQNDTGIERDFVVGHEDA